MPLQSFQNTFTGNPLNRESDRRSDSAWLAEQAASPHALALALRKGQPLIEDAGQDAVKIAWLPASLAADLAGGAERLLFMGLLEDRPVFAADLEGSANPDESPLHGLGRFEELRGIALRLPPGEAAMLATAKAMFEWSHRHTHCAVCGAVTQASDGGWKRQCPSCQAEHFPRTDPVVIMLPFHGERCLLGRQASWPEGMFSALAGFMEPGESIEEACARELAEEAGLKAVRVRYHSSQPWPFPSSLMIGLIAEVESDQATADQTEISEVRWFTRDESRRLLADGVDGMRAPPAMAIAHQLLRAWADEEA
ncbi:MAG: MutT/nudix family protein [Caulobacteraceae bacterium]|nr:MutT/nudix family protein [Caulobacteraceae bacterium]